MASRWKRTSPSSSLHERMTRISQLCEQQRSRKLSLVVQIQAEKARLGIVPCLPDGTLPKQAGPPGDRRSWAVSDVAGTAARSLSDPTSSGTCATEQRALLLPPLAEAQHGVKAVKAGLARQTFKMYSTAMLEDAMRTPSNLAVRNKRAGSPSPDGGSDDARRSSADTWVSSHSSTLSGSEVGVQKCVKPFNCACWDCFKHPAKARNVVLGPLIPRRDIVGFASYSDARSRIGPLLYRDGS